MESGEMRTKKKKFYILFYLFEQNKSKHNFFLVTEGYTLEMYPGERVNSAS